MKMTNARLIVLLVVLVAVYAIIELTGGKSRSEAFKKELVTFTADNVDRLIIGEGDTEVTLNKSGEGWNVKTEEGYEVAAVGSKVDNALGMLQEIKPSRVAAKEESKWGEYEVDSAGTRVQVFEAGKKSLDIVLGRFGVKNQRQFYSFVRLKEDPFVYAADDFMAISFPKDSKGYRDNTLIKFTKDSVNTISFVYPADSSFVLKKEGESWTVDGNEPTGQAPITDFISDINYKNSTDFADDLSQTDLGSPVFSLLINTNGEEAPITLEAYQHDRYQWVLRSSLNPGVLFSDSDNSEIDRFFKGKTHFE